MGIFLVIGGIILFTCVSLVVATTEWKAIVVFGYAITIILFGKGVEFVAVEKQAGQPKTSIEAGSYTVVGYVEVLKEEQSYYQMILEQEGGVKLYTLRKDMIDIAQNGAKGGTLEVVEKSGLRKAILYLPIPGGVNPFP